MVKKEKEIKAEEAESKADSESLDIEVADPEILRPRELPLVVKPANGKEWKNEAQAEYARTLNGYAYANPKKWAVKKDVLLKRLVELGDEPGQIVLYRGNMEPSAKNLEYKNNILQG